LAEPFFLGFSVVGQALFLSKCGSSSCFALPVALNFLSGPCWGPLDVTPPSSPHQLSLGRSSAAAAAQQRAVAQQAAAAARAPASSPPSTPFSPYALHTVRPSWPLLPPPPSLFSGPSLRVCTSMTWPRRGHSPGLDTGFVHTAPSLSCSPLAVLLPLLTLSLLHLNCSRPSQDHPCGSLLTWPRGGLSSPGLGLTRVGHPSGH